MYIVQVNDGKGVLKELVWMGTEREIGAKQFLDTCSTAISNWDNYDSADLADVLDDGYAEFGGGAVMFIDTSGCITDDELRDQLTKQPGANVTVAEIVQDGEIALKEGMTVDQIIEACCGNLNAACSWDIQGQILFKGSDGKWYTITTESIIGEANPEFVEEILAEIKDA